MKIQNAHPGVVVVTGASAGVGRATALAFAKLGMKVGLIARGEAGLRAAKQEINALGAECHYIIADVADADAVETAASIIEQNLGPIDIWVNNAMTTIFSPFAEISPADFRRATEVTYLGTVHGTMSALRRMKQSGRGTIVQVGSALAYRSIPLQSPYCGAKHAIKGFTDSLRSELLHTHAHIHLCMVQLPALNTPQFDWCKSTLPNCPQPVPPIYQPEVAAKAIVWSALNQRRETYVGWPTLIAIVGNKLFPRLGDYYLALTGYETQQTDQPKSPDRKSNLYAPLPEDHGAHGRFDARAKPRSSQLWLSMHRYSLFAGGAMLLAAVGLWRQGQLGSMHKIAASHTGNRKRVPTRPMAA